MIDKHYTSKELAEALVGFLPPDFKPDRVADFAAGEGSLLDASQSKWPEIDVIANDLSLPTVRFLH